MIVPSIDLQNGQAVQLRQGKDLVLTSDTAPAELARRFGRYGSVAVIDLDAAMGKGDQLALVRSLARVTPIRAGGGVRDAERAKTLLRAGVESVIIGTVATEALLGQLPRHRTQVALDHRAGEVVDRGWTGSTGETVLDRAQRLAPYCGGFLITFVEHEGTLGGFPIDEALVLSRAIWAIDPALKLTMAGGIKEDAEVITLSQHGLDVQVGMALYQGLLDPAACVVGAADFAKQPYGLIPTIAQAEDGTVLMLAYSSPESVTAALTQGKGIYWSRSRGELWEKGKTSGHTQELLRARLDCDRDTLLFTVKQAGPACHTGEATCFGPRNFKLEQLFDTLAARMANPPEKSYTAKLLNDPDMLAEKIREESGELIEAPNLDEARWEFADLLYFASVLAARQGLRWQDIEAELGGRHGLSHRGNA